MASVWKGSINFGLVSIPVELRPAVRRDHVSFRLLYKKDLTSVRYERFSAKGAGPLSWDDIVKGFEVEKGRYVVLTDQDFRDAALGKSASIEILDFVEASSIDPRYFETPYYLTPIKGSEKPYALLRAAVRKTNVVGIGKIVIRNTQHLVGIKATGEALMLEIMRFQNELVETDEFRFPKASEVRPQELEMAEQLVHNLAADFDPKKYTDEYPTYHTINKECVAGSHEGSGRVNFSGRVHCSVALRQNGIYWERHDARRHSGFHRCVASACCLRRNRYNQRTTCGISSFPPWNDRRQLLRDQRF